MPTATLDVVLSTAPLGAKVKVTVPPAPSDQVEVLPELLVSVKLAIVLLVELKY